MAKKTQAQLSVEREQRWQTLLATYTAHFKTLTPEELAWDFHCNITPVMKGAIRQEAHRRGIDLCSIYQIRRGGPVIPGAQFMRSPCKKNC